MGLSCAWTLARREGISSRWCCSQSDTDSDQGWFRNKSDQLRQWLGFFSTSCLLKWVNLVGGFLPTCGSCSGKKCGFLCVPAVKWGVLTCHKPSCCKKLLSTRRCPAELSLLSDVTQEAFSRSQLPLAWWYSEDSDGQLALTSQTLGEKKNRREFSL